MTIDLSSGHATMPAGFNGKDDIMPKEKRFGSSSERHDALDTFEIKMIDLMRKAIRAELKRKGISHYVRDGAIVITEKHRDDEKWAHHFRIDTSANHI